MKQNKSLNRGNVRSLKGVSSMSEALAGQKRNRRIFSRSGDFHILQSVAIYQFVSVEMVAEDVKRNIIAVRRRMLSLYQAGVLNRARRDKLAPYIYFLSEKGSEDCLKRGLLNEPRYITSKSSLLVSHDLEITLFHRELEKRVDISGWDQWRGALRVEVETKNGTESLIPDAKFSLGDKNFCLEIVKSYESEYEGNESNIERKLFLYNEYWKQSGQEFRVLFVMPTKSRVAHFLAKIEERFPLRRFWFTDEESYRTNVLGKIWWTPRDFREATYALIEHQSK
jgi:hypothetical protein